ncbi:hypothetical protein BDN72DRAFT_958569 [Pluteus cervinus]|uniref:Uncharacterized protein n=1 Tax=Pluteus cervinus TaxID=181527 RepID=A0ACD3B0G0_9AGAR|nr:hypothetical protein BDN72DRAFT_958569 [Pluteus cervinus]
MHTRYEPSVDPSRTFAATFTLQTPTGVSDTLDAIASPQWKSEYYNNTPPRLDRRPFQPLPSPDGLRFPAQYHNTLNIHLDHPIHPRSIPLFNLSQTCTVRVYSTDAHLGNIHIRSSSALPVTLEGVLQQMHCEYTIPLPKSVYDNLAPAMACMVQNAFVGRLRRIRRLGEHEIRQCWDLFIRGTPRSGLKTPLKGDLLLGNGVVVGFHASSTPNEWFLHLSHPMIG